MDADADPNGKDLNSKSTTPLTQASKQHNKTAFVDVLLDPKYSTDINLGATGGRTPLHFAATAHNNAAITKLVKDKHVDLNAESIFALGKSNTSLGVLCFYGVIKGIKAMLAHPATTKPVSLENLKLSEESLNAEISVEGKKAIQAYRAKYYP